jgi:hypothetical protein
MMKNTSFLGVLCLFLCLSACSNNEITEESQIRQYIESGKMAAESRSHNDMADLIHDHYHDDKSLSKQQLIKMLRAYFFMHKNIHLFIKIDDITVQKKNRAFVVFYVAMAGNVISGISSITSLRGRVYKFELQLIKADEWLLEQAKWKRVAIADMM